MGKYDFWIHGVNVQVEYPDRMQFLRRTGWGTIIRQTAPSINWFHFVIPTPTVIDDTWTVLHYDASRARREFEDKYSKIN